MFFTLSDWAFNEITVFKFIKACDRTSPALLWFAYCELVKAFIDAKNPPIAHTKMGITASNTSAIFHAVTGQ